MSEERKQVLTMLAEGKITAEEAESLLEKLGKGDDKQGKGNRPGWGRGHRRRKHLNIGAEALPDGDTVATMDGTDHSEAPTGALKYLRVEVHSSDGDQVSVRVPLRLIRTGVKLTTMLPSETNAKLAAKGIDLTELGSLEGEELVDALRDLKVDVDSADGDTVRVFCE
jgi:hypothetical protein